MAASASVGHGCEAPRAGCGQDVGDEAVAERTRSVICRAWWRSPAWQLRWSERSWPPASAATRCLAPAGVAAAALRAKRGCRAAPAPRGTARPCAQRLREKPPPSRRRPVRRGASAASARCCAISRSARGCSARARCSRGVRCRHEGHATFHALGLAAGPNGQGPGAVSSKVARSHSRPRDPSGSKATSFDCVAAPAWLDAREATRHPNRRSGPDQGPPREPSKDARCCLRARWFTARRLFRSHGIVQIVLGAT